MILSDAMLWRMIWKEYRAQRGFWLVIAGFSVVLMLLFIRFSEDPTRYTAPWIIAIALPAVYAVGCAAVLFAAEREDGTTELLQIMAARTSRVFLGKVSFSFFSTVAMLAFLLAAAWALNGGRPIQPPAAARDFGEQALGTASMTLQFLAWGFLISALCRKALTAVCLTAVMPLVILVLVANFGPLRNQEKDYIGYWGMLSVVPLVAASYFCMRRTLAGRTRGWSLPGFKWRSPSRVSALDRLAGVREISPAWRRTLKRLIWLELKQALSIGHVLWIGAVYLLIFIPFQRDTGAGMLGIAGIIFASLFMGVWTFQAEGGRRIRFLADHGLSPQMVWLSKQIVWGLLTAAFAIPYLVAVEIGNLHLVRTARLPSTSAFHEGVLGASATVFAAILGCLAYGAGQFASVLISRGVTAGFVGFVLFGLLAPWTWLMIELRVPLSISVASLFLILLGATLGWSRRWLLEQATGRSWRRLALLLCLSFALVWSSVGAFRVYEVPRPDFVDEIGTLREAHGARITPEEAGTATLYRRVLASLKWTTNGDTGRPVAGPITAIRGWEFATEFERRLLAENQDALQEGLAVTERPTCAFNDPSRPIYDMEQDFVFSSLMSAPQLATVMLLSARELEAQGKLDEALNRYVAVMRFARHVANRGTMRHWEEGIGLENMVRGWIGIWASHPAQSPERVAAGAARIGQEAAQFPPLRDAVLTQQCMMRRTMGGYWLALLPPQKPGDNALGRIIALRAFERFCPWERARALRVLDLVGAAQLHCLDYCDQGLGTPGLDMQHLARLAGAVPQAEDPTLAAISQNFPGIRFGPPGDFFNPQQFSATLQERVPWNWVKTTFPLNLTLNQSVLWKIWQLRQHEVWIREALSRLK
jgi:hypothetical protein